MMLNKVILIGRLGRDPETRYMPNGDAVCNFSIATSESWKDQQGIKQERTEWHNITMYRKTAEIAGQYLRKGSLVYLEGKIQTRKYTDKTGAERTAYDIVCDIMKMLGSKDDNAPTAQPAQTAPIAPPTQKQPANAPVAPQENIDSDIPF
ncbi:single-stranded DNA-binding protein [Kingella kingae]|uniref:single-stranded DNA-binding protein n=3 Tax=Kingella kingae TaxID=504 RepID=UPI00255169B4|nr:single-stranded DNA-binding protein [Kingella kingae]MDK4545572.1 single-stranded DNA-binding protein [Kingella kingae]MDK4587189.1 single-stranded DNA-binding protein [Kingella kingae]